MAAIKAGKDICLANKETLIAGGPYVLPLAAEHNVSLLPADSEHSAIFQCIQGLPEDGLRRVILTASGEHLAGLHPFCLRPRHHHAVAELLAGLAGQCGNGFSLRYAAVRALWG